MSLVSTAVGAVAESDDVWREFLPSDYLEVLSRLADSPLAFKSKKELYLWLCSPMPFDNGKKVNLLSHVAHNFNVYILFVTRKKSTTMTPMMQIRRRINNRRRD